MNAIAAWHDFSMLIGTASATLIGLMFVAASVSTGYQSSRHETGLRTFLSPSVVHLTCVLIACAVMMAPVADWNQLGVLIGADGLFGIAYSVRVWRNMIRHGFHQNIDQEDRTWYALLPIAGHGALAASGGLFLTAHALGSDILAGALGLLMLASIRNAWDMTIYLSTRPRS